MKMLTVKETAQAVGKAHRTITHWISNGTITAEKIGDVWQITAEEVERIKSVKAYEKRGRKKYGKRKK